MPVVDGNTAVRSAQVRLSDLDPDFLRLVRSEEREQAAEIALPAVDLTPGPFAPGAVLSEAGGSCGVIMAGLVNRQIHVGAQVAMRVLGLGGVIPDGAGISPDFIATSEWTAATTVRLAVIGNHFFRASARWPQLQGNLITRFAEQNEQLAAQLAVCQLPRVEDRLLAMLWVLAESWGKVTSAGTLLPLQLTHEALGAMVGARRPTVTLALGELAERGAVIQRPDGWLLLEPPAAPSGDLGHVESPRLLDLTPTAWARTDEAADGVREHRQALLAVIARLRKEHRQSVGELQERIRRAEAIRTRAAEIRSRVQREHEGATRQGSNGVGR